MTDPPSAEEMAAIMAAVELVWPRPVSAELEPTRPSMWRFSGRWWSRPHAVQRERPWVELR
ncbi:MAG: hypothetical protein JO337_02215 [Acidimicrobiales bacterium]|nr:hypothetical protein [Acidimicrobiales bacterium]